MSGLAGQLFQEAAESPTRGFKGTQFLIGVTVVKHTRPDKSHINYVVADTETAEQKLAQALESMDGEVPLLRP